MREQLALSYRVCHKERLNEGCDNHLSVMVSDNSFLTLPYGILWSEVQPSDFVLVDFEGNILRKCARIKAIPGHSYEPDITAIKIHASLHRRLGSRAKAVFHTHQHYSTALACYAEDYKFKIVHQNSARYYDSVVYYRDFGGLVDTDEEGNKLADCFEENDKSRVMLLRHHGIITVGPSATQALEDLYYFEISARVQVELRNSGQDVDACCMSNEAAEAFYNAV